MAMLDGIDPKFIVGANQKLKQTVRQKLISRLTEQIELEKRGESGTGKSWVRDGVVAIKSGRKIYFRFNTNGAPMNAQQFFEHCKKRVEEDREMTDPYIVEMRIDAGEIEG